jgi:hypothetical protein
LTLREVLCFTSKDLNFYFLAVSAMTIGAAVEFDCVGG